MGSQMLNAPLPPPPVYHRNSPPPPSQNAQPAYPSSPSDQKRHIARLSITEIPSRKPLAIPTINDQDNAIMHSSPVSPVRIDDASNIYQASSAQIEDIRDFDDPGHGLVIQHGGNQGRYRQDSYPAHHRQPSLGDLPNHHRRSASTSNSITNIPPRIDSLRNEGNQQQPYQQFPNRNHHGSRGSSQGSLDSIPQDHQVYQPLQYHHQPFQEHIARGVEHRNSKSTIQSSDSSSAGDQLGVPRRPRGLAIPRPNSAYSDIGGRGRTRSLQLSPNAHARAVSSHSAISPDTRPLSFVDLLNVPYPQPPPAPATLSNAHLRSSVGNNASLLSHKQTFEMYLANVKKTNDPGAQYEFAVFMIHATQESPEYPRDAQSQSDIPQAQLLREAKAILQRLADRSYPYAQYYLADGLASGLFSKGKPDLDKAFQLFVAASKHGHAEAGYRAALCYEFGWGSKQDGAKAIQFYRQAASKNHPGAMARLAKACLAGDMGLGKRYREGITWLKRAAESADAQYNSAPYELGLMHETGYGDDVFQDESYAAQLFTRSAELGHAEANYRLGDAYEHGKLNCPRDPALSVHFYTTAAQVGHSLAMMALCAWFLCGAEPILDKNEDEAYEWARRAAECGLAKAEYAVGYFTEMGIGCRRDPLEANVWYVRAADHGDDRARHRIAAIREAASGGDPNSVASRRNLTKTDKQGKGKRFGIF
ncbi:hypothetical protein FQN57_003507 [Myotisia sp. PD_48]|nr:hypothetical protein FQN57_003507 [Myotisia sp. PD_48]